MTNRFLFEIDFDLLVDKKGLYLFIVFACIKYNLTAIMDIVLEEAELAFKLKK